MIPFSNLSLRQLRLQSKLMGHRVLHDRAFFSNRNSLRTRFEIGRKLSSLIRMYVQPLRKPSAVERTGVFALAVWSIYLPVRRPATPMSLAQRSFQFFRLARLLGCSVQF